MSHAQCFSALKYNLNIYITLTLTLNITFKNITLKFQLDFFFSNLFYFVYFCWCNVQDYCLEEILLFWTGDKKEDEKKTPHE